MSLTRRSSATCFVVGWWRIRIPTVYACVESDFAGLSTFRDCLPRSTYSYATASSLTALTHPVPG